MTNGTPVAIQEYRKGKMERLCLLESETEIQEAVKRTLDAMTAAKELKGFLYGFSALVVKIRRNGNRQKQ